MISFPFSVFDSISILSVQNWAYFVIYFLNSLIFMIVNLVLVLKNKYLKLNIYFYILQIIFLLFSLFMTYYLKNAHLLIIGNIYPEITIGNYIYFIYYIAIILIIVYKALTRNK